MQLRSTAKKSGNQQADPLRGCQRVAHRLAVAPTGTRGHLGQLKRRQQDGRGNQTGDRDESAYVD